MNNMIITAGEIQARRYSGAKLAGQYPKGELKWEWNLNWKIANEQMDCFAFIRGLQAGMRVWKIFNKTAINV